MPYSRPLPRHLVRLTLHTNDAPSSISRLVDIGVRPFLINSTLIGVLVQRLVRKICQKYASWYHLSEDEYRLLGLVQNRHKPVKVTHLRQKIPITR